MRHFSASGKPRSRSSNSRKGLMGFDSVLFSIIGVSYCIYYFFTAVSINDVKITTEDRRESSESFFYRSIFKF